MNRLKLATALAVLIFAEFISSAQAQELPVDSTSAVEKTAKSEGWALYMGIGYALSDGMGLSLDAGYKFGPYLGLYADVAVKFKPDQSEGYSEISPIIALDAAIVPRLHFSGQIAVLSIGLGLGYFFYKESTDSKRFISMKITSSTHAFLIRPELSVDFIFASGFIFGVGLDVPAYIGTTKEKIDRTYHLSLPNGQMVDKERHYDGQPINGASGARFDLLFHLGYKF